MALIHILGLGVFLILAVSGFAHFSRKGRRTRRVPPEGRDKTEMNKIIRKRDDLVEAQKISSCRLEQLQVQLDNENGDPAKLKIKIQQEENKHRTISNQLVKIDEKLTRMDIEFAKSQSDYVMENIQFTHLHKN
ncbi:uncharacterized protein LOC110858753 isoform X2 [Folsomia candida]|uniref:uncharacterized protein LOC110858753 isoform X2 n=1 Tax=Folsomia candida TaxID=158441 RepID=UPI000B8F28A2|nr:uncharacterized protein LOC110858753 isoform X2 [Folsomia candida]